MVKATGVTAAKKTSAITTGLVIRAKSRPNRIHSRLSGPSIAGRSMATSRKTAATANGQAVSAPRRHQRMSGSARKTPPNVKPNARSEEVLTSCRVMSRYATSYDASSIILARDALPRQT